LQPDKQSTVIFILASVHGRLIVADTLFRTMQICWKGNGRHKSHTFSLFFQILAKETGLKVLGW